MATKIAAHGAAVPGRPHPAVAATRLAVRQTLASETLASLVQVGAAPAAGAQAAAEPAITVPPALLLVACSGGPDSLALAAATAFEAPRRGMRAGAITIDHGLQPGSADQAARTAVTMRELGLDPVLRVAVRVGGRGAAIGYPGPEAAARQARYGAFDAALTEAGAAAILLGHTMDDQAETVLLGLARGSGARSIAGMAPAAGRYLRPLLGLRRAQTAAACAALGLRTWDDPQNLDLSYSRVKVRTRILPLMEELIGPGVTESLARTADQLRADADLLDSLAGTQADSLLAGWADGAPRSVPVVKLTHLPDAIRTRLLRLAALAADVPSGSLSAAHVSDLDALITNWHGQRWVDLPGGVRCQRRYGRLHFTKRP